MGRLATAALIVTLLPVLAPSTAVADQQRQPLPEEIILVTGDRVLLSGSSVSPLPGEGRQGMGFRTYEISGHRYVIPLDAVDAVASGRMDRRLFDITSLKEFGYANTPNVPLIVSGDAMTAAKGQSWQALKARPEKIWLDGKRKLALAESVPQVGAPAAWQSGFTGKGVTVAVLDTGIDATHPDFAGRIADRRDFTGGKNVDDKIGHGTHVASTIAGSGAASNGKYRGVAPDATLVIGKVCGEQLCPESAIIAGMEWAAREKKARVVNLSLGGPDSEEVDPLEETVNELSAETGALFVVASGNSGPRAGSVSSPSTADAALAVGAATKQDEEAWFSSRGPRIDGAVKPEIAAPGMGIVAALARNSGGDPIDESYTMASGTSMATPHVAGAAALLAQQRPTSRGAELKSTLVSSAQPLPLDAHQIGAGRLDASRAVKQSVVSVDSALNLGTQRWPHDDDKPVSGTVTYRNTGSAPITLSLAVTGELYSVDQKEITVPAGGTGSARIAADTRTGPDGHITGMLTATAGETRVVTPLTVNKEAESYDLKVTQIGRDGKQAKIDGLLMVNMTAGQGYFPYDLDGSVVLRKPKGHYVLDTYVATEADYTHITVPSVTLDHDQSVTLDARQAKIVRPVVPRPNLAAALLDIGLIRYFDAPEGRSAILSRSILYDGLPFYTLYQGQPLPPDDLDAWAAVKLGQPGGNNDFTASPVLYHMLWAEHGKYWTGLQPVLRKEEFAEVREHYHATPAGKFGYTWANGRIDGLGLLTAGGPLGVSLPFERTDYFQAGRKWGQAFGQYRDEEISSEISNLYGHQDEVFKPGTSQVRHWNRGVFSPAFDRPNAPPNYRTVRTGDAMNIYVASYPDSTPGRTGYPMAGQSQGRMALYRDGTLVGERPDLFSGYFPELPPEEATYRAEMSLELDDKLFPLSTRTSTAWTFRSAAAAETEALPVMLAKLAPNLDAHNSVRPNQLLVIPVTVQRNPGSKPSAVTSVTMEVSADDGATWRDVPVYAGKDVWYGLEVNPVPDSYPSLKVTATDKAGGKVEQTVLHAYRVTA
nr:S8 family serine peptidase [Kibdelosporangium sp. MJ126-NF4]CEL17877.1 putative proteinase [Kibdelosporangium sp. MJ126-NF4]CTQ90899.1 putative proteinase [Kibdelosporangium sp. MJ126-NF4]